MVHKKTITLLQFQSTLPRRERQRFISILCKIRIYFNPRSREGSDKNGHMYGDIGFLISIHAPAKGATKKCPLKNRGFLYFNPRSREGSDHFIVVSVRF